MDPRSEVLLRNADCFAGRLLLAGLPADDLLARLPDAHGWSWHAGEQAILAARFPGRSSLGIQPPPLPVDAAVLFLPKSRELTDYLLAAANEYFAHPITRDDIVWTYSAVRPLFDDGASKAQEATRDYVLKGDSLDGETRVTDLALAPLYVRAVQIAELLLRESLDHRDS